MSWKRWFKLLVAGFLLVGLFLGLADEFWQIKGISCRLDSEPCPELVWAEMMNLAGRENIFLLSSAQLVQKIKESHPEFAQVEVKKELPDKLVLNFKARQAVVAIKGKEGFYLVDSEGILLEKTDQPANFALIFPHRDFQQNKGEKVVSDLLLAAIQALYEGKLRLLEPQSARLTDEKIIELQLKDGLVALFSGQKDISQQLDSLQFIFQQTKIKGEALRLVDLRFDKPVILGAGESSIGQ